MSVIKGKILAYLDRYTILFDDNQIEQIANRLERCSCDITAIDCEKLKEEVNAFVSCDLQSDRRIILAYFQKIWNLEADCYLALRSLTTFFNYFELELNLEHYIELLKEYSCLLSTLDNIFMTVSLPITDEKLERIPYYSDISQIVSAYMNYRNLSVEFDLQSLCGDISSDSDGYYSEDSMTAYVNEAVKYPILTYDEERMYLSLISQGDASSRDYFIACNLRLVIYFAKKFQGRGLEILDLIQEGNIGLIRALDGFDMSREVRFSTYASDWIRQSIGRAINDKASTIRKPVHIEEKLAKLKRAQRELFVKLGREANLEELATELGWTVSQIKKITDIKTEVVSLQEPTVCGDRNTQLGDLIADENDCYANVEICNNKEILYYAMELAGLSEKEKSILMYRNGFYNGRVYTLEDIGAMMGGVSRQCVNRNEKKALGKMKNPCVTRLLSSCSTDGGYSETFKGLYRIQWKYLEEIATREDVIAPCSLEDSGVCSSVNVAEYQALITELMELADLSKSEKEVMLYRDGFFDGKTHSSFEIMKAIGKGISARKISELESTAVRKLQNLYSIYCKDIGEVAKSFSAEMPMHDITISIYDYFNEFTKAQVDLAIMFLSLEEIALIKKKYGEDYQCGKKGVLTATEARKLAYVILPRIGKILRHGKKINDELSCFDNNFCIDDYKKFLAYIDGENFKDALKALKLENSLIAVLYLLTIDGKRMPLRVISLLCGITDKNKLSEIISAGIAKLEARFGVNTPFNIQTDMIAQYA